MWAIGFMECWESDRISDMLGRQLLNHIPSPSCCCMCVCLSVFVSVFVYVCVSVCECMCVFVFMFVCMSSCLYACLCVSSSVRFKTGSYSVAQASLIVGM